jgi:hypothetical protein
VGDRVLKRIYVGLAVLAVVPIWSAAYIPTVDGPSHVYNSWLIRMLLTGGDGAAAQVFAIDWRPHPNWIGHAVMALLMFVVPPVIAEKLLVTGIVLLFFVACWMYAGTVDESRRAVAFVAMPFAYNFLLHMGFYNFCIGAALYFIVLAVWWRRRDRPDARTLTLIASLLVLIYFSHVLPAVLAVGSIGILWLATLRGRRVAAHARHLIAFVPLVPLFLWFLRNRGVERVSGVWDLGGLLNYLRWFTVVTTFDTYQARFGTGLSYLFIALIVVTLARRRWRFEEGDAFLLVTFALLAIFLRSPRMMSGGTMILERMALFVTLSPLAWLAPRLPRRATAAMVILLTILSLVYGTYLVRRYRGISRRVAQLVRSADEVPEGSRVTTIIAVNRAPGSFLPLLDHAFGYVAAAKHVAQVDNYEVKVGYFPIKLREEKPAAEYVFAWQLPPVSPAAMELAQTHRLIAEHDGGRVYLRNR